jgi:cobyrinic acid a,c-diamide synthase
MVSSLASGQGKTLVTAALALRLRWQGKSVRILKIGADFLDPLILERASGSPVYQIDLFLLGETQCRDLLARLAEQVDVLLIEGAMGLFDGTPSAADLALLFDLPVLAVIDASAMAQSFGAVALGLASYRPGLRLRGALANRVGHPRHAELLRSSLPQGVAWCGSLPPDARLALPERHLGLQLATEIAGLEQRLSLAASFLDQEALQLPAARAFAAAELAPVPALLPGTRIAVAQDDAFCFLYPANCDLLRAMGAELRFFSPLAGQRLPECDALWLPGGYPELHLPALAANRELLADLGAHHRAGRPVLAECGGMLYLCRSLTALDGEVAELAALLPAAARMQSGLSALGLQTVRLPEGELRGHTFHHSLLQTDLAPIARALDPGGRLGEPVYRMGRLLASYLHLYFPSNPVAVAQIFHP